MELTTWRCFKRLMWASVSQAKRACRRRWRPTTPSLRYHYRNWNLQWVLSHRILQFHHLDRLLFVHGTLSLFRTSKCILFSLYKNVLETVVLVRYSFLLRISKLILWVKWESIRLVHNYCGLFKTNVFNKNRMISNRTSSHGCSGAYSPSAPITASNLFDTLWFNGERSRCS